MKRLLGVALLGLAACHTVREPPRDLPYPPQRVFQNAYSFMPPAELGWKVLARTPHELALARAGSGADETFAIQGRMFRLPAFASGEEFVAIIRKGLAEQAADPRYRVLKHEVSADAERETVCARSYFLAQDHALILEARTRSCAHPRNKAFAVTLVFSHRRHPEHADAGFAERAQRFLSSLEFLE